MSADAADRALDLAEQVSDALTRRGHPAAVIGATAMGVHGYTRATRDVDVGTVGVPIATLHEIAEELRALGHCVEVREPDAGDPLGGVLRIEVDDELQVDVVNFGNPWTGAGRRVGEAAFSAPRIMVPGRRLAVLDVEPLVILKLAAGSRLDLRDAAELLARHPEVDRDALRTTCASLRLSKRLERVFADLAADEPDDPLP